VTPPSTVTSPGAVAALPAAAAAAGLTVVASASWPETPADVEVPTLAGYIESTFSPLIAEVASRVLRQREPGHVTAIVIVTTRGDVTSATRVAAAVSAGKRVAPLLFYQSVPNSVAGYLAARWRLTGPVVCVSGIAVGLDVAALLIADGDADDALIVQVDLAAGDGDPDRAAAVIVAGPIELGGPAGRSETAPQ
jgi:hypothetical protein